ncbi:HK97 family phage prohead protease [Bradyrhizobium diazoefficiens]
MKKRFLDCHVELKALDDSAGKFSGYGSVFGTIDSYKEAVDKGAFTETLKKNGMPALLWQHRSDQVIGIYTVAKEDDHGLYIEGQLNMETQQGREAYSLLKQGALNGLSIGFRPLVEEVNKETGVIHIKKLRLYEVSIVTFPANEDATVDSVKSAPDTIRDFEEFLREAGKYSREDAKLIASKGFRALETHREGGDQALAMDALQSALDQLRKATMSGTR